MNRISACLITLNEEHNLARALQSLRGIADEIVVVDCGSTDRTPQIAREYGARFFERPWTNYSEQKNFAAENAAHDWVFSMDADEEISPPLRKSLLYWKNIQPQRTVYEVARRTWYLGAWIRHSGWYPDYQRRLYRRDSAKFKGIIHEALRFDGEPGLVKGDLLHYTVQTFAEHEANVEKYTTLAAKQMFDVGKRRWKAAMWLATPWSWFQNYILRGGFLDGSRGALISKMAARSVWLKYSKLGKLIEREGRLSRRERLKPLLVDLEVAWRGGQNQALLMLKGFRARGYEAELVAANGSALGQRAIAKGFGVHFVSRGLLRLPAALEIRHLLGTGRFALVHANEAHAVSASWLARAHKHAPFLISRRVGYPIGQNFVARARYTAASRIIANSQWVAAQAAKSGVPSSKLTTVYEGAEIPPLFAEDARRDARSRWRIAEGAPLLGCVGVMLPDKGQEWLIRALPEIRKEFPETKLLLAGDGPSWPELSALARELGLQEAVLFPGFVKDVDNVYAALDVFLLPSFFEALNNSLLAAMAYEIPSIAFNKGALGEIIEHEKSGLLVSGPNVTEISDATKRLLRDRAFAASLGREARKRVQEHFSAERMIEGMLQIYRQVLPEQAEAKTRVSEHRAGLTAPQKE
jgi:glycosyltransferase involved in cell wall biosynthesis